MVTVPWLRQIEPGVQRILVKIRQKTYPPAQQSRSVGSADIGRKASLEKGNEVIKLSAEETKRWETAGRTAHNAWIEDMNKKGLDGQQMYKDLLAIAVKYEK